MLALTLAVSMVLAQGSSTMAGTPPAILATGTRADFATLLTSITSECPCTALTMTDLVGTAVTTNRGSAGMCTKADGTMVSCGNNLPRVSAAGLLIEATRTNLTTKSQAFNDWTCTDATTPTADTVVSPTGTTDAEVLVGTGAGGYCESPSFTIASTSAAVAAYVQATSGTQDAALVLRDTTAGADRCTGTVTATTSWSKMEGLTDTRLKCASAAVVSGNTHVLRLYPGGTAGTGTVRAFCAQTEAGQVLASSCIPTVATSVARSNDNINTTLAMNIRATGCWAGTVTWPAIAPAASRIFFTNGGRIQLNGPTTSFTLSDGSLGTATTATTNVSATATVLRAQFSAVTHLMTMSRDAQMSTPVTYDDAIATNDVIYLGNENGAGLHIFGWMKNIKFNTDPAGCQ